MSSLKYVNYVVRLPNIGNLMINESGSMKDSVIFPRKYQKMSTTCVWHVSDLMRTLVIFMTVSAFLISSFLLVYKILVFHSEN